MRQALDDWARGTSTAEECGRARPVTGWCTTGVVEGSADRHERRTTRRGVCEESQCDDAERWGRRRGGADARTRTELRGHSSPQLCSAALHPSPPTPRSTLHGHSSDRHAPFLGIAPASPIHLAAIPTSPSLHLPTPPSAVAVQRPPSIHPLSLDLQPHSYRPDSSDAVLFDPLSSTFSLPELLSSPPPLSPPLALCSAFALFLSPWRGWRRL